MDFYAKRKIIAFILLLTIFLEGCSDTVEKVSATVGNDIYSIEVARTRVEQEKGLMFRDKIDPKEGMIFVYNEDRKLSFWMKNTYVPLSIAFLSKDGTIKEIHQMKPGSLTPVNSVHSVRYALELPLGSFKRSKAEVGDKIILPSLVNDYR